jgi:acyl dehydratase
VAVSRQPSHLPPIARLLRQSFGRGSSSFGLERGAEPGRRLAADRRDMRLDQKRIDRFLDATGGAGIEALTRGGILPPTYCATWETALALEVLAEAGEGLPLAGMIHLESELLQLRPIARDDLVSSRVELEGSETSARGVTLRLKMRCWNGAGQLCTEGATVLLLRSRQPPPDRPPRPSEAPGREEGWTALTRWNIAADRGRRYARASGDFNPIHLWAVTARPLGFSRPILQGFCTQSLVAHSVIEHALGGDPAALRRLRIAFRAPISLPATLSLQQQAAPGTAATRFRVVDDERVVADGEFLGARC